MKKPILISFVTFLILIFSVEAIIFRTTYNSHTLKPDIYAYKTAGLDDNVSLILSNVTINGYLNVTGNATFNGSLLTGITSSQLTDIGDIQKVVPAFNNANWTILYNNEASTRFLNSNYTSLEDYAFRNINFTILLDNYLPHFWNLLNFTSAINLILPDLQNVSVAWNKANFTISYDSRTDRFDNENYTSLAPTTSDLQNVSAAYNKNNFTSNYDARTDRFLNFNWTALYDNEALTRWSRTNQTEYNDTINSALNLKQTESSAFKISNGTSLPFSSFTMENGTALPFSNFTIENGTALIVGGEVSGTVGNIILGDSVLDDQYILRENTSIVQAGNISFVETISWANVTKSEWVKPEYILDVDKEDIESDLNTFVDIAGDTMTGTLIGVGVNLTYVNISQNLIVLGNIFGEISNSFKNLNWTLLYDMKIDRFSNENFTSLFLTSYENKAYYKKGNLTIDYPNLDTDSTNDFSGVYSALIGTPATSNFQMSNVSNKSSWGTLQDIPSTLPTVWSIANVSNYTSFDSIQNMPDFSNFQLSNVSNNTINLNHLDNTTIIRTGNLSIVVPANEENPSNATISIPISQITDNGLLCRVSDAFNKVNASELPFSNYTKENFTTQYDGRTDRFDNENYTALAPNPSDLQNISSAFNKVNASALPFSNMQLSNISNTTSWSSIINIPAFSNFQSSNVTINNATIELGLIGGYGALFKIENGSQIGSFYSNYQLSNFTTQLTNYLSSFFNIVNLTSQPLYTKSNLSVDINSFSPSFWASINNTGVVYTTNSSFVVTNEQNPANATITIPISQVTGVPASSNMQISNVSNTTSWSNIINIPSFSNMQLSNISNDTLHKTDNLTIIGYVQSTNVSMKAYTDALLTGVDASAWNYINNETYVLDNTTIIRLDNRSWVLEMLNNATINRSINLVDYNRSVDLSGYLKSTITNGSDANLTNLNVYSLNGSALSLFNKSIELSTYNKSINYITIGISQITNLPASSNFQSSNVTINNATIELGNIGGYSAIYKIENFTKDYENQAYWKLINLTDKEGAYFKKENETNPTNATIEFANIGGYASAFTFANNLSYNKTLINMGNTSWIQSNEQNPTNTTIELGSIGGYSALFQIINISNTLYPTFNATQINGTNITGINITATRFTGKLDCGMIDGGSDADFCADATGGGGDASVFNLGNYSVEYSSTGYKLANFTLSFANRLAELWNLNNFTFAYNSRLTELFNLVNYSSEYSSTGFKISNYSTEYASTGWKLSNATAINDTVRNDLAIRLTNDSMAKFTEINITGQAGFNATIWLGNGSIQYNGSHICLGSC